MADLFLSGGANVEEGGGETTVEGLWCSLGKTWREGRFFYLGNRVGNDGIEM